VDRFGPNCAERRAVRDFHFDQLSRLLLPPHTKFLLWLVHQPAEFFVTHGAHATGSKAGEEAGARSHASMPAGPPLGPPSTMSSGGAPPASTSGAHTLWSLLCGEIGLSVEQADKVRLHLRRVLGGADVPRETWRLGIAIAYLQRLRAAITARAASAHTQLETLRSILTPAQLVRYLVWMDRNRERIRAGTESIIVHPLPQQDAGPVGRDGDGGPGHVYDGRDPTVGAHPAAGTRYESGSASAESTVSTPDATAWAAATITPTTMSFAHAAPHVLQPFASQGAAGASFRNAGTQAMQGEVNQNANPASAGSHEFELAPGSGRGDASGRARGYDHVLAQDSAAGLTAASMLLANRAP
jgi:hypothetical protein